MESLLSQPGKWSSNASARAHRSDPKVTQLKKATAYQKTGSAMIAGFMMNLLLRLLRGNGPAFKIGNY